MYIILDKDKKVLGYSNNAIITDNKELNIKQIDTNIPTDFKPYKFIFNEKFILNNDYKEEIIEDVDILNELKKLQNDFYNFLSEQI